MWEENECGGDLALSHLTARCSSTGKTHQSRIKYTQTFSDKSDKEYKRDAEKIHCFSMS